MLPISERDRNMACISATFLFDQGGARQIWKKQSDSPLIPAVDIASHGRLAIPQMFWNIRGSTPSMIFTASPSVYMTRKF